MKQLFIDTSVFIALGDASDCNNKRARQIAEKEASANRFITSDHVLDETATLLGSALGTKKAVSFVQGILSSRLYKIYYVDAAILATSLDFMSKFADRKISCTDASTMAFVRTQRIPKIFTFDPDFRKAGFSVIP